MIWANCGAGENISQCRLTLHWRVPGRWELQFCDLSPKIEPKFLTALTRRTDTSVAMTEQRLTRLLTATFSMRDWRRGIIRFAAILTFSSALTIFVKLALLGELATSALNVTLVTIAADFPLLALVFYVVTKMEIMQDKMRIGATTDALTGLLNRGTFLQRAVDAHRRSKRSVLLMVDADFFKSVNDIHGHAAGDEALRTISRRLRSLMRESDVVGRLGGEEFAVMLPGIGLTEAMGIAHRLSSGVDVSLGPEGHLLAVTLSVGAVEMQAKTNLDTALKRADEALYLAKERGRARVETWEPEMDAA